MHRFLKTGSADNQPCHAADTPSRPGCSSADGSYPQDSSGWFEVQCVSSFQEAARWLSPLRSFCILLSCIHLLHRSQNLRIASRNRIIVFPLVRIYTITVHGSLLFMQIDICAGSNKRTGAVFRIKWNTAPRPLVLLPHVTVFIGSAPGIQPFSAPYAMFYWRNTVLSPHCS